MTRALFYFALTFFCINAANAATLITPSYVIDIESRCEEGNVACDDVSYKGVRKSDGATLELTGRTLNRTGSFSLYGYEFKNGAYVYYVYSDATFLIQRDGKTISSQKGYWQ